MLGPYRNTILGPQPWKTVGVLPLKFNSRDCALLVISFSIHKPMHLHHPLRRHCWETWKYFSRDYKYSQGRLLQGILTQQELGQGRCERVLQTPLPSPPSTLHAVTYRVTKETSGENNEGQWERSLPGESGPTWGQEGRGQDCFRSCPVRQLLPRVEQRLVYLPLEKVNQSRVIHCVPIVCWPLLGVMLTECTLPGVFQGEVFPLYLLPPHPKPVLHSILHRVIAEMLIWVHCYIPRTWTSV